MGIRSASRWIVAVGVLAAVAGPAGAQPPPAGSSTSTTTAIPPTANGPSDGQVTFSKTAKLSPQEQVSEAAKHIQKMETALVGLKKTVDEARKQRDVVKTLCLTDKQSQIEVSVKSGKDRHEQLKGAAARNDVELAGHNYTIITVLRQRTEQTVAEAAQCIGEESAFVGDTQTNVTIDPHIPHDETPYPPLTDPSVIIDRPQCTTCVQ
jgi:hypothetical protein